MERLWRRPAILINVAHLGAMIESVLGDGAALGVRIAYSREAEALETAGGIAAALPLLGESPFVVANGDIFSDFEFERLRTVAQALSEDTLAHLVLVENPPYHVSGDFCLRRPCGGRCAAADVLGHWRLPPSVVLGAGARSTARPRGAAAGTDRERPSKRRVSSWAVARRWHAAAAGTA
jgi:hypothetical protein